MFNDDAWESITWSETRSESKWDWKHKNSTGPFRVDPLKLPFQWWLARHWQFEGNVLRMWRLPMKGFDVKADNCSLEQCVSCGGHSGTERGGTGKSICNENSHCMSLLGQTAFCSQYLLRLLHIFKEASCYFHISLILPSGLHSFPRIYP